MITKMEYIQLLRKLISEGGNSPSASSLATHLEHPDQVIVDTDWGNGVSCDELLDLYEFRKRGLPSVMDRRAADLELLCNELRLSSGQRCLLSGVCSATARFSIFINQNLSKMIGCIEHDWDELDPPPSAPRG